MKQLAWILALTAAATSLCPAQTIYGQGRMGGGAKGQIERITVVIKADGSSVVTNESVTARDVMEQGIRVWEVWKKRMDAADDESVAQAVPDKAETKPYTDAELAERIRETETLSSEQYGTDPQKIESIDIKTNTVRMVQTRSFASLSDLLSQVQTALGSSLAVESLRFESTNGQLRVTHFLVQGMQQRYAKAIRQQWKDSGAKLDFKFIFPGKVLSSWMPNTQDSATWISVDGEKPESVDALMKLSDTPMIILCELGGLKLDAPLDSKALQRQSRRPGADAGEGLPITDAGPGFLTEGISVTTSSVLVFPEGEKFLKEALQYSISQTGTTVRAKLFAPKGRTLKSASGVRVLKAVDDKGRELGGLAGEAEDENGRTFSVGNSRNKSAPPLTLTLRLPLPAADAGSMSELSGEAIVLTVGQWKEFTVTNLQASATNEIDLGSILPGAKLALTKVTTRNQQVQIQARLKGPREIRHLELQCRKPGNPEFNTHANDMNFSTKTNESIRTISIQGYGYGEERGGGPMVLVVRSPEDLRRERVRFSLKDLDLF